MELNSTLPFSDEIFFSFMAAVIVVSFVVKAFIPQLPFSKFLAFTNSLFILVLYPNPIEITVLIIYLYLAVLAMRKWMSSDKVLLPMLILALPIYFMKSIVLVPNSMHDSAVFHSLKFFQIAGLSYMVFKVISLYIDERKNLKPISFLNFFNFTAFTPTLLIGPLDRFAHFNNQLQQPTSDRSLENFSRGWENLILGVLYKFIIAELIHRLFLSNLSNEGSLWYHIAYMYAYLMYLFFDFAGYSLLAISFGKFIGVEVPINFDKPFLSVNPKEFWKKWHKSLGDWLGDYFFKPIFKWLTTKKYFTSITRQNIALFSTFTLMGFWNGFEFHYIVSGALFGLFSVGHNYYIYRCKKSKRDVFFGNLSPRLINVISIFIMFNLTAFSIYIFSGNLF